MYPSSSLVISTYNWPEALTLCLKSALAQKWLPDEIIIADDGSADATRQVIASFQKDAPVPIIHIWHEDEGFRLAQIRNRAIAAAKGDYIIQVDGDIIMHPYFISDHVRFAKKNSVVRASRIYLNKEISREMLDSRRIDVNLLNKGVSNVFSAFRVPFMWPLFETSYKNTGSERYEIHGCNMAFWRKDAIAVNGYNESFKGWGPEDKEFVVRLLNIGLEKRFLKLGGIAYHIYHEENTKINLSSNEREFMETISSRRTYCESGINKYIS